MNRGRAGLKIIVAVPDAENSKTRRMVEQRRTYVGEIIFAHNGARSFSLFR